MTAVEVRSEWLASGLDALIAGDIDAWMQLYNEDAVHEFPYAPPGFPRRLEGKATITEYMRGLPGMVRFDAFHDVEVHATGDPNLIVAELQATGRVIPADAPFHMSYVWFITFHDGLVSNFRDYMNPLKLPSAA